MALTAEYGGNTDGQFLDKTGNGNTLLIYNAPTPPVTASSPTPPEGDRWLGYNDINQSDAQNTKYKIPFSVNPDGTQGYFSCYFRIDGVPDDPTQGINPSIFLFNSSDGISLSRYIVVNYQFYNSAEAIIVEFTDTDGNDHFASLPISSILNDGLTHFIVFSWDTTGAQVLFDGTRIDGGAFDGVQANYTQFRTKFVARNI